MSAQGSQWARRSSPSSKQGPMKATLPMSSLTRQNSNINYSIQSSPSSSPTSIWKSRVSPDPNLSGIRSPGAINYKVKRKGEGGIVAGGGHTAIRRTASLDTIYLNGQWPRECLYLYTGSLQVDRSTQTEEWLGEVKKSHQSNEEKFDKYIRHRMRLGSASSTGSNSSGKSTSWLTSEGMPRHRMRSSVEGLNQEIEKLVLRSSSLSHDRKGGLLMTPEGHRAPLAELLRQTRSVNTQTPAYSNHSSGPPSRDSGSPMVISATNSRPPSSMDHLGGGSEESSPEHEAGRGSGCSPRINKFFAREPPDGCERVCLRFIEQDNKKQVVVLSEMDYPLKPSMNFQLKPSLGSAFHPLRSIQPQTQ